jgi:hypothetical protein
LSSLDIIRASTLPVELVARARGLRLGLESQGEPVLLNGVDEVGEVAAGVVGVTIASSRRRLLASMF